MKANSFFIILVMLLGLAYTSKAQESEIEIDTMRLGTIEVDPRTGELCEVVIDAETKEIYRKPIPELDDHLKIVIKQCVDLFNIKLTELWKRPNSSSPSDINLNNRYKKEKVLPETLKLFINDGKEVVTTMPTLILAHKDPSGVWYYNDGKVRKDISQKRLIPIFVVGYAVVGSCQNGVWYEYGEQMTSTTKTDLQKNYPKGKEMMGYMATRQYTTPAAKVQVASVSSNGKKNIKPPLPIEIYLNNIIRASTKNYKKADLDWSDCKFGKFKQIDDTTYECNVHYAMSFRGYSSDMFMIYGDKTYKSVKVRIYHHKIVDSHGKIVVEKWIVKLCDIKVNDIERLSKSNQ